MNSTIRYERIKRRNASRNPKIIARNRRREHRLERFSRAIRNEFRNGLPEKKRKYWLKAGIKAFSIPDEAMLDCVAIAEEVGRSLAE